MADCERRNPLVRSGTNQDARALKALDPAFAKVDERKTADLIAFAQRLSRHIRYYDKDNAADGDWSPFFASDISAILARLGALPVASFRAFFTDLQEYLTIDPSRADSDLASHFKLVFYLPLMLLQEAGEVFVRLPRGHPLRDFMQRVMARDVDAPLRDLIAFYKGVLVLDEPPISSTEIFADTALNPADYNLAFDDSDPRIQIPSSVGQRIAAADVLSAFVIDEDFIAAVAPTGWSGLYAGVDADSNPYLDSVGSAYNQIFDALNYNLLADALQRLFQAVARMAQEGTQQLDASLTRDDTHTPHFGLWLAFLRLFEFTQAHMNGLTGRHLDHYYRDILRLCLRKSEPDRVHLLFELNKTVRAHLLKVGTLFKAGKDATGKDVAYRLDADFVVNRAKVDALKSLYVPKLATPGALRLPYAAPMTNSRDGQGEALAKDEPHWKPFGPAGMPKARIGFALADRQLFLRDGNRTILVVVTPDPAVAESRQLPVFKASLTTAKGWLELTGAPKLLSCVSPDLGIVFMIQLDGNDPPIVGYDAKVHGEGFSVAEPVVKIEFAFDADPAQGEDVFALLRNVRPASIVLQATAQDVRNFTLANDFGPLDPSKPFLPFGPAPEVGASLILGSSELFSKTLEKITLHLQWEKQLTTGGFFRNDAPSSYTARVQHLNNSTWSSLQSADVALFPTFGNVALTDLTDVHASLDQTVKNEPYSGASSSGFLRLVLRKDFGHAKYLDLKTLALIDIAKDSTPVAPSGYNYEDKLPKPPYTPKLVDFSLSYRTAAAAPARFFHLYPFGHREVAATTLFPPLANEGELYIGVKDLDPPQRLSLLFQVAPGTANPLKGENDLAWHYLRGDEWVAFDEQDVDDKSSNLTGSGIVGLAVPADADTAHTVLPAGLHWLRMAAPSDADALNDLLLIAAQASSATFVDSGNDPAFLATPLPAGTIAKLKVGDEAIKTITQPYPSFGGKPQESDGHFHIRASERLRHKDRSVTMWDYERLVLEAFPKVYLVKCVNHTALTRDLANNILADNELKPGHVLVVTVPYVGEGPVDPLRPYTDKQTQVAIDRFLRGRVSPFVQLEVQNPKIEEVQVKFRVAFTDEVKDVAFYKLELNNAIIRYLTPWAHPEGADISFGGKWHKSAIIDFIEEQPYVEYITDVEMYHRADISQSSWSKIDEEVAQATTARSILVSHAAHEIEAI